MKCQKCDRAATIHITEIVAGVPEELHLCEQHARDYLSQGGGEEEAATSSSASLASALAQQLALGSLGNTAEDLARLDQRSCPVCGITFYEFRNRGRFGCPHDYTFFARELEPLLMNIHGETHHTGKRPKNGATDGSEGGELTELIRLRREMKDAVEAEDYERASELRDEIRAIEHSASLKRRGGEV